MKKPVPKTDEEKADATLEMMGVHAGQISEHVDAVLILDTMKQSDGHTLRLKSSEGDDYAAYGIAKAFVTAFEGAMKKNQR